jgi:hypothetical protein
MKKQKVQLTERKKRKRKNESAIGGKLSLKTSPSVRAEIDEIAKRERVSINFFCVSGIKWFLKQYRQTGDMFLFGESENAPRAGRKRTILTVEK